MRSADLLFLPMHDLPPGRAAGIVPYKTYEYLAAERPILAAVPDGDARDLLRVPHATLCRPKDVEAMAAAIADAIDARARRHRRRSHRLARAGARTSAALRSPRSPHVLDERARGTRSGRRGAAPQRGAAAAGARAAPRSPSRSGQRGVARGGRRRVAPQHRQRRRAPAGAVERAHGEIARPVAHVPARAAEAAPVMQRTCSRARPRAGGGGTAGRRTSPCASRAAGRAPRRGRPSPSAARAPGRPRRQSQR